MMGDHHNISLFFLSAWQWPRVLLHLRGQLFFHCGHDMYSMLHVTFMNLFDTLLRHGVLSLTSNVSGCIVFL
jgi:hypothetical protein